MNRSRIVYKPVWRDCETPIVFWENLSLAEIQREKLFVHENWWDGRQVVRFGVSDSGRLLVGDAWDTLHADIMRCALAIGDDEQLFAGAAIEQPNGGWELRFYPAASRHPTDLSARLSTWAAFIAESNTHLRSGDWEPP